MSSQQMKDYQNRGSQRKRHSNRSWRGRPRSASNVSKVSMASMGSEQNHMQYMSGPMMQKGGHNDQNVPRHMRWDRDRLSREIWKFYLDNRQTPELMIRKMRLRDALQKILTTKFPDYKVEPFIVGSTANGLASNKSDVDICLVMTEITEANGAAEENGADSGTGQSPVKPEDTAVLVETAVTDTEGAVGGEQTVDHQKPEVGVIVDVEDNVSDKLNKSSDSIDPDTGADVNTTSTPDPSLPLLEKVQEVLKGYNFVLNMQIIMAKVPILKFVDRISGIEVTLNVNKVVSIRNTRLIHDYTKLDWRVQPLVMVVKAWAKDHGINDAYNKSISSYSLVLMVIHYLQYACAPPVLPCLQQLDPARYAPDAPISSLRQNRKPKQWKSDNHSSLKDLLLGFLEYYSYNFCFAKDAISVRLAHVLPKHICQRYKSLENAYKHWKLLSIEEPFNRTNTARSVYDDVTFERITSVFRVSHYTLRKQPRLSSIMSNESGVKQDDYSLAIDQYVNSNVN